MTTLKRGSRGEDVKTLQRKLNLVADGIFGQLTEEAVREFQKSHSLAVDGIVGAKTWAALGVAGGGSCNPRKIKEIIVHYSATPEGENFTVDQIRQMHLANGWSDIGYHWYVDLEGNIFKGRDEKLSGAHCTGHNTVSIGVCYCGGCPPRSVKNWQNVGLDTRTPDQKNALLKLLKDLKKRYPGATIHGHREFANKPCPGFDARSEYSNI